MSVNTSDEYLDELLQAIEPIIYKDEPVPVQEITEEPITENVIAEVPIVETPIVEEIHDSVIEPQSALEEVQGVEVSSLDNVAEQEVDLSEFAVNDDGVMDESNLSASDVNISDIADSGIDDNISLESLVAEATNDVISEDMTAVSKEEDISMDDLLAALTSEENAEVEEMDVDALLNAAANVSTETSAYDSEANDNDVKELLKQFTDDEDLADIGDILERNDNSEAVDEAVLVTPEVEVFQLDEEKAEVEEQEPPVKEKKGLFSRFKKDKKKKKKESQIDTEVEIEEENRLSEPPITEVMETDGENLLMEDNVGEIDLNTGMVDTVELDSMDLGSLMELGGEDITPIEGNELSLDGLFGEGDMADIDQLLAAGSFEEIGGDELLGEGIREKSDSEPEEKKSGFFGKILNALFEEEEEEPKKNRVPEADATGITDENMGILDELSKEEKKKRKKEEKERKKKEKEAKKNGTAAGDGEGEVESEEDDGKEKKKKKKVKKQKPREVVDIDAKPEKKLSRKKVSIVFLFCFSILVVILLFRSVVLDLSNLKEARWAYDNADYETCYVNLYGEELSEEDERIFQKSYIILCVQRKLDSYENFIQMDMGVEALNALFDGVRMYRDVEERAAELGILDRISGIYQTIYGKLESYGLSKEEIEEILSYESKVTYTKRLESIVNGTPFENTVPDVEIEEQSAPEPLLDVLPQEEDFLPADTSKVNAVERSVAEEEKLHTTVEVGSTPSVAEETEGMNVGKGNTNVEVELDGNSVVVY